jgi:hypothetical protein
VLSNRYSGNDLSVASNEFHDCGRKMCTCNKLVAIKLFTSGLLMSFPASLKAVTMMLSITWARRGTLKWCNGSKRMMAPFWPDSGIEENVVGSIACAIMR